MTHTLRSLSVHRSLSNKITESALVNFGVLSLADIFFGPSIKMTKKNEGTISYAHNSSNRTQKFQNILLWTPPVPKMPTRNLAVALVSHKLMRGLPSVRTVSEHSEEGWGAGSVYSMINRSSASVHQFSELLFDKIIVVLDGMTQTPFLLRSVTPRARLLFVTSQEPTKEQTLNSDAIVRYNRKVGLTDELLTEIAANIKHIIQIHTARPVTSYVNLKGVSHLAEALQSSGALRLDQTPDAIVFVLREALSFGAARCFEAILEALYDQSEIILLPSYLNLAQEGLLSAAPAEHIRFLMQLLKEGMRCQVVLVS